jgi:outer membrane protein OmpU
MNKFKKIGLSALAGSLVATSAFAGEMSVSGGASIGVSHTNGNSSDAGKSFSMGNQLTFSGGGELDNGLNVALSFVIDQNDDSSTAAYGTKSENTGSPFDSHSVTISSDAMGSLKFSGEGGSSAISAMDTTAAGDIWDEFDSSSSNILPTGIGGGDNSMMYTLPAMVDGVAVNLSYTPRTTGADATTAWNATYSGVEGLSASVAMGDGSAENTDGTAYKLSYAFGPITAAYSSYEYDAATAAASNETTSYAITYTVSDELSVTYGAETIEEGTSQDVETWKLSAAYTAGGMTISADTFEIDNQNGTTAATEDREKWALGVSFAF